MAIKKIIIEYEDNDDCLKDFWNKEKIEKEIKKHKQKKTAQEMFKELGFEKCEDNVDICYVEFLKSDTVSMRGRDIYFSKKDGSIDFSHKNFYGNKFLKLEKELILAIVEQLSELWEENNK